MPQKQINNAGKSPKWNNLDAAMNQVHFSIPERFGSCRLHSNREGEKSSKTVNKSSQQWGQVKRSCDVRWDLSVPKIPFLCMSHEP